MASYICLCNYRHPEYIYILKKIYTHISLSTEIDFFIFSGYRIFQFIGLVIDGIPVFLIFILMNSNEMNIFVHIF